MCFSTDPKSRSDIWNPGFRASKINHFHSENVNIRVLGSHFRPYFRCPTDGCRGYAAFPEVPLPPHQHATYAHNKHISPKRVFRSPTRHSMWYPPAWGSLSALTKKPQYGGSLLRITKRYKIAFIAFKSWLGTGNERTPKLRGPKHPKIARFPVFRDDIEWS